MYRWTLRCWLLLTAFGQRRLSAKPRHLNYKQAAALPLAGLTAFRAVVSQGQVQPKQKVLVTGIGGGVSPFCVQFANALGADVYVTSSQQTKIDWSVKHLGAKGGANYKEDGWDAKLRREAKGFFDLIVDGAAGDNFEKLQKILRPGGRIVSYGGTTLSKPTLDIYRLFLTQQKVIGSSMGSDKDWSEMIECVNKHNIVPVISSEVPLSQAIEAIVEMGGSQANQLGKVVITVEIPSKL
jgi:zinc-binding alcohol dehydrogenase/oxidoreductase